MDPDIRIDRLLATHNPMKTAIITINTVPRQTSIIVVDMALFGTGVTVDSSSS